MNKLKAHIKTILLVSWMGLVGFGWIKLAHFADTFIDGLGIWVFLLPLIILAYVFFYFANKQLQKKD